MDEFAAPDGAADEGARMLTVSALKDRIAALGSRNSPKLSPIAVDFGARGLKAVQLSEGRVLAAARLALPEGVSAIDTVGRLDAQLGQLRELVKGEFFRGKRVMCVVPSEALVVKHLQVDAIDGLDTSVAARLAAADQLGIDPDRLVHRCHTVTTVRRGQTSKAEVVSMSSPLGVIERLVGSIRRLGLDVVGMHAVPVALAGAFAREVDGSDGPVMIAEVGSRQTMVAILERSESQVVRSAPIGCDAIDEAMSRELGVDASIVQRAREAVGTLSVNAVAGELENMGVRLGSRSSTMDLSVGEVLEDLAEELMVAVRYHRGVFPDRRVSRVVFTGGGARCVELCRRIAERLALSAQVGDPLAAAEWAAGAKRVGIGEGEPTPGFSAVVGLASCRADL